jgi:hypothetical protein
VTYLLVAWKWLLSFTKRSWSLEDYPIRFRQQELSDNDRGPRRVWVAHIHKWAMTGFGDTREQALADLRTTFASYREAHDSLPRPGTHVPLEFAATVKIDQYRDIARDFLDRIFHLNYDECFISDESSLGDFHAGDSDELHRKIAIIYGVDVSDVERGLLVGIFERIAERRR